MGTELTTVKNLINKKAGDNSEVQSFSDENNDSVKLDNILTISEDNDNEAPGDSNGNEAPGGSNTDGKNLKSKQKKKPWWEKSEAQPSPQPPPTQLCSQLEERPDIKIAPAVEQQVTKNTTKLNSFIKMAEEWHNTLSDLSNTNQHLEERLISTMHNWFKDLELKMQQKVEGYLSGAFRSCIFIFGRRRATLQDVA